MRQYIYIRRDHSRYQSDQLDKVEDRIRSDGYHIERIPRHLSAYTGAEKILMYVVSDQAHGIYRTTVSVRVEDQ